MRRVAAIRRPDEAHEGVVRQAAVPASQVPARLRGGVPRRASSHASGVRVHVVTNQHLVRVLERVKGLLHYLHAAAHARCGF